MYFTSEVLKEVFLRILDKAQAYELVMGMFGRETPKELKESLVSLYQATYMTDETNLKGHIRKTNRILSRLISECDTEKKEDIRKFLKYRRVTPVIEKEIKRRLSEEAENINMLIESMDDICNEEVTPKRHTENGKLIKQHVCIVCSNTFNSNRKNAKYCSSKCKQAAYRENKDRYSNSLI